MRDLRELAREFVERNGFRFRGQATTHKNETTEEVIVFEEGYMGFRAEQDDGNSVYYGNGAINGRGISMKVGGNGQLKREDRERYWFISSGKS